MRRWGGALDLLTGLGELGGLDAELARLGLLHALACDLGALEPRRDLGLAQPLVAGVSGGEDVDDVVPVLGWRPGEVAEEGGVGNRRALRVLPVLDGDLRSDV